MKTAITADLQFDEHASYSASVLPSGITSRLNDMLMCFAWIVTTARAKGCTRLIVIGDIFDSRTTLDISVVDSVCRAFHAASESMELIIVPGNHDSYLRSPDINSLQVFRGFATIVEQEALESKKHYEAKSKSYGFVPWHDDPTIMNKAIASLANGKCDYLFTHVLLAGATLGGKGFPVAQLCADKFKRVFLGDVHDPLTIGKNIQYVGSPMQIHFGDAGGKRGFFILDDSNDTTEFVENTISPRFHKIVDAQTDGIRNQDFVRVATDDPEISAQAVAAAKKKTGWVESTHIQIDDTAPRLDIRSHHEHAEVLARFVAHQGYEGNEALISLGLEILEEAKGG